jgi:hypothetical protein
MTRASIATWTAWRPSRSVDTPSSRAVEAPDAVRYLAEGNPRGKIVITI